jgi:hypothetical protein
VAGTSTRSRPSNRTQRQTQSSPLTRPTCFNRHSEDVRKAQFTTAAINWSSRTERYAGHLPSMMDLSPTDRGRPRPPPAAPVPEQQPRAVLSSGTVPSRSVSGVSRVCPIPEDGHTTFQHLMTTGRMIIWTPAKDLTITPTIASTFAALTKRMFDGSMLITRTDTRLATLSWMIKWEIVLLFVLGGDACTANHPKLSAAGHGRVGYSTF